MKKIICLLLLSLISALGSTGYAQRKERKTPLQAMVETERAFAQMSVDQGTRPAFMAFIAEDGILFRPTAVKGKQWMTEHPVPASDKRPLLSWYPAVAGMSRYGDLGYSTGPWEFRSNNHDAKAVAWGTFLTVWKRQPDGQWKFAVDLGISNPEPAPAPAQWMLPGGYSAKKFRMGFWTINPEKLRARDREFSQASAARGARKAFAEFAATEVRVYREGKSPIVGKQLGAAALPENSSEWTWEPAASDVSNSDDLGYTYGSYKITTGGSQVVEAGSYLRVWKKVGGAWKVLFDLTNPIPPETKKND